MTNGTVLITISDLTVSYEGSVPINGVSESFADPLTIVVGPSGSGKTSLLRVLAGLQAPSHGVATIDDIEIRRATWRSAADERVILIHQDHRMVDFLTVAENMVLAAELRGLDRSIKDVGDMLDRVSIDSSFCDRMPTTLSGGELQRVAIARALMCDVRVLLADEPTGALDVANTARVVQVLQDVAHDSDVQVVVATHDPIVADASRERWRLSAGSLARS